MAECRITPYASSSVVKTVSTDGGNSLVDNQSAVIPEGKVEKACKEWLVREDGVLAYRLQNEEITQHYEGNRCKNRTTREDIPLAKCLQKCEEEQMRNMYERELQQQLEVDERVAKQMQDLLLQQERERTIAEQEDEKLAQRLADKEKARIARKRLQREKRQVEKLSAQLSGDSPDNERQNCDTNADGSISTASEDDIDLSEFCMQPPEGLSEEELRVFREEQDSEIARFLQTQECKRKGNVDRHKLATIEAQDYQIAKLLAKEEKERIKRLKEKARLRTLQKQTENSNPLLQSNSSDADNHIYDEHMTLTRPNASAVNPSIYCDADSITYEEPYQIHHHNIAIDLDPTYKRNSTAQPLNAMATNEYPNSDATLGNGIHFAQLYNVSSHSSSDSASPASTTARAEQDLHECDDLSFASIPPYFPVQGQRRSSTDKKKKKSKDSCKTQ